MPRSTANFISYDLRPAKQTERRILIDVLKTGGDCGLPLHEYRYVGMGANRFYDFLLMHKHLGMTDMVSLEHDPVMFKRALFNVPYSFIDVRQESVAAFIANDVSPAPSVYWLDYDGGIGGPIVRDIAALGMKLKVGDFAFVTVFGGPPRLLERMNDRERLAWIQDHLGDVSGEVIIEDMQRSGFPTAVFKILLAAFKNAVAPRRDGVFVPLLKVEYSDSSTMITVGGAFLHPGQAMTYKERLGLTLPFLTMPDTDLYEIGSLHITDRERHLFDRAATASKKRTAERNALTSFGFDDNDIAMYRDLIRYLPRYVETMV
jgi:hypothetical protein